MMYHQRIGPRAEYRQQENERIKNSVSLAERYQELKSLTVDLAHFHPEGFIKTSEIKYTVNLVHAKSLFRFHCSNEECVGGDFDLSAALANAVKGRHLTATGELVCQGWRSKTTIDRLQCHSILRYTLSLGY